MALRNALRLALAGATGAAEGYGAKQTRLQQEEQRRQAQERQRLLDAAALRNEQREAIAGGMVQADQYNPRGIAGGMDMPGATPRSPVFRQIIGGKEFVLPEAPSITKHRESIFKTQGEMAKERQRLNLKNAEDEGESTALENYLVAKGLPAATAKMISSAPVGVRNAMLAREVPVPSRGGGKEEPDESDQRDIGLAYIAAQARNPALMRALQTEYSIDPRRAEDPGLVAYRLKKNKVIPTLGAGAGYKPSATKVKKKDDLSLDALLNDAKTTTPAAAGAPAAPAKATTPAESKPSASAPAAKPAAKPEGSMADAAWKQAQRAERWDQIKARNPNMPDEQITAQVMREIP